MVKLKKLFKPVPENFNDPVFYRIKHYVPMMGIIDH